MQLSFLQHNFIINLLWWVCISQGCWQQTVINAIVDYLGKTYWDPLNILRCPDHRATEHFSNPFKFFLFWFGYSTLQMACMFVYLFKCHSLVCYFFLNFSIERGIYKEDSSKSRIFYGLHKPITFVQCYDVKWIFYRLHKFV